METPGPTTRSAAKKRKRADGEAVDVEEVSTPAGSSSSSSSSGSLVFDTTSTPSHRYSLGTPSRVTRLEEKQELQDLNKRLQLYILKQRQRDADQSTIVSEFDSLKKSFNEERQKNEDRFKQQVDVLQTRIEQLSTANAALVQDRASKEAELGRTSSELAHIRSQSATEHIRIEQLTNDLQRTKSRLSKNEEDLKSLTTLLDAERARADSLQQELESSLKRSAEASSRLPSVELQLETTQRALSELQVKEQEERTAYEAQIHTLNSRLGSLEREIRKEFAQQLKQHVKELREIADAEKAEGIAELKREYDEQMNAMRKELHDAGKETLALKAEKTELQTSIAEMRHSNTEVLALRETLERQIKSVLTESKANEAALQREIQNQASVINDLREALRVKDQEFTELLDVKVALAMEIRAYRDLLEGEEERLGLEKASENEDEKKDRTASVLLTGSDLGGRFVVIRNGTTNVVKLKGWTLRSVRTEQVFKLPSSTSLKPNEILKVWVGADARKKATESELAWAKDAWDLNGDEAQIIDADGNTIHSVNVRPQTRMMSP